MYILLSKRKFIRNGTSESIVDKKANQKYPSYAYNRGLYINDHSNVIEFAESKNFKLIIISQHAYLTQLYGSLVIWVEMGVDCGIVMILLIPLLKVSITSL